MPIAQLLALATIAMVAQIDADFGLVERLGAFAIAIVLCVWGLVSQRKDNQRREDLLRADVLAGSKEKKELSDMVMTQVVPLLTKATEVLQETSRQLTEAQRVIMEQQRLHERLSARVEGMDR